MKEMEYQSERLDNPIILANGFYRGYEYWILNLGTHPTAYVHVPHEHKECRKDYDEIPVACHYGLTYSQPYLYRGNKDYAIGWIIGWDYAHYGDYSGNDRLMFYEANYKKWTTKEIFKEVKNVIEQLDGVKIK